MKYKVGDWVQIIDRRGNNWSQNGAMDKYIGSTVKITSIDQYNFTFDGQVAYVFNVKDIAGYSKNKIVTDILMDL